MIFERLAKRSGWPNKRPERNREKRGRSTVARADNNMSSSNYCFAG
jgi:hypothetical protein